MKRLYVSKMAFAVMVAASAFAFAQESPGATDGNDPFNAVVKLEFTTSKPDIFRPWTNRTGEYHGSGVVIGKGRILTCAHNVADTSYIRVRKPNEDNLYHASVQFVDNDSDLAIIAVDNPAFMNGVTPMELGETPHMQDDVLAVGYPMGGTDISYTRGIVSRIEDTRYAQALTTLLAVQIDAAINPGNSGGPVLDLKTGKIAGIAFQGNKKGESLGYIIPPDIIRHFLKDIQDGSVEGFSDFTLTWEEMESPAIRRYYRMGDNRTGVLILEADPVLGKDSVKKDDVILEIDGYKVSNNGRIRLKGGTPRSLAYPIYTRQIGEKVPVKVYRDGAVIDISITVSKKNYRVRRWMYDTKPDYFVYGGFVFTTISYDYVLTAEARIHDKIFEDKAFADDEPVAISFAFADAGIEGYAGVYGALVRTVNGAKVRNLRHLVELVEACKDGFVCFGLDRGEEYDFKVIVDAREMRESTVRVMKRNQIPSDRSEDLRGK